MSDWSTGYLSISSSQQHPATHRFPTFNVGSTARIKERTHMSARSIWLWFYNAAARGSQGYNGEFMGCRGIDYNFMGYDAKKMAHCSSCTGFMVILPAKLWDFEEISLEYIFIYMVIHTMSWDSTHGRYIYICKYLLNGLMTPIWVHKIQLFIT